ncbi:RluA family pseudouridine synthase [Sporobolomyces salmoneus]|uniref:RluA family pseudouridine synthase n=1 Tax=Sporobolomyces salmoneus TaxID=183962 RepID=UPI0031700E23
MIGIQATRSLWAPHATAGPRSTVRSIPSRIKSRPRPAPQEPDKLQPDIVYEDDRYLVLNKPNGIALQGQFGSPARKLWDDILETLKSRPGSPEVFPVHRLDKATTGTLLLAKSQLHAARLSQQLAKHQIQRQYLAIVYGQLKVGFKGTVAEQLRVDEDKVRVARGREGEPEGVDARTDWECVAASPSFSLLSLSPSTGRKHQLRVHLAECLRASIVGDFKYSPDAPHFQTLSELSIPTSTTMLHASRISFHAWAKNGKRQTIEAIAPVPPAFERFCRAHKLKIPV